MSPERIQGENYGIESDVWSLGLTLLEVALIQFNALIKMHISILNFRLL